MRRVSWKWSLEVDGVPGRVLLESVAAALESAIFFPDMVFTEIGANGIRCCPQEGGRGANCCSFMLGTRVEEIAGSNAGRC